MSSFSVLDHMCNQEALSEQVVVGSQCLSVLETHEGVGLTLVETEGLHFAARTGTAHSAAT